MKYSIALVALLSVTSLFAADEMQRVDYAKLRQTQAQLQESQNEVMRRPRKLQI